MPFSIHRTDRIAGHAGLEVQGLQLRADLTGGRHDEGAEGGLPLGIGADGLEIAQGGGVQVEDGAGAGKATWNRGAAIRAEGEE